MNDSNSSLFNSSEIWNAETKIWMQSAAITMLLLSTYLVIAIIVFQCRKSFRKPLRPSESRSSRNWKNLSRKISRTVSAASIMLQTRTADRHLDKLHLISALTVTARCIHEVIYAFTEPYFDFYCNIYLKVHIFLYALPIASIYIFLWMRQRFLYKNPKTPGYNLPYAKKLSWLILMIMLAVEVVTIVLFLATRNYHIKKGYCEVQLENEVYGKVPWAVLATATVTFQILLMFLFVYPLLTHRKNMTKTKETIGCQTTGKDRLIPLIKRAAVTTGICVASDILAVFVTLFTTIRISNYIYDLNLLIDLLCITFSFENWKQIMFLFRSRKELSNIT